MAAAPAATSQVELLGPPNDAISRLRFARQSNRLLVSSWDRAVRLYDVDQNECVSTVVHSAPVLDCCFGADDDHAISASLHKRIALCDLQSNTTSTIGSHDNAVSCINFSQQHSLIISAGWDGKLLTWDSRAPAAPTHTISLPTKAYSMDARGDLIIVSGAQRFIRMYDMRILPRESMSIMAPLEHQLRCVRLFPDASGFAVGSTEGRISIDFINQDVAPQNKQYAFKCHRKAADGREVIYPVNDIAFHPGFPCVFASGGCDSVVNIWDGQLRKRRKQFTNFATSISSLSFNHDGSRLAIASSYTFEQGECDHPADQIFVRQIQPQDVMPPT